MSFTRRSVLSWLVVGAVAFVGGAACSPTGPSGIAVTATVSSATLAQDCPDAPAAGAPSADIAARCAPRPDGGGAGLVADPCGSLCRQSNVQLALTAGPGRGSATVELVRVRLIDAATGAALQDLASRSPQVWSDASSSYVAWDGEIDAGTSLRVSYKIAAPDWSRVGDSRFSARRFRLELTLRIDGVERVVSSEEVTREPEIVT